jgi:CRISPR type I-E-associated protein CasB/Cse2
MQPDAPSAPPAAVQGAEGLAEGLAPLVHALMIDIQKALTAGEVSQLRRMRPDNPGCPAFWKLAALRLDPAGALGNEQAERRWTALLAGMASMSGLLRSGRRLGQALAAATIAEPRVLRLLRAQDDALLDAVRVTAQQLAAAGQAVDWLDFAFLVLSDGGRNEARVRRRIARDYYSQAPAEPERRSP